MENMEISAVFHGIYYTTEMDSEMNPRTEHGMGVGFQVYFVPT